LNERSYQERLLEILGKVSQPARLIGDEIGAGPGFGRASALDERLRVVLAFPDTYEIGISNQALQILYHLARSAEGVAVERTYLPWVDVRMQMKEAQLPLLTLETWTPVAESDLLGLTLQHEFNYTNVLELLDMAGLPVRAEDRREGMPLVIGGGPATADFLPLTPFFEAFVVGDGEEVFPELLGLLVEAKDQGMSRHETRDRLSRVEGVYVPGVSRTVRRRVVARLEDAAYPTDCLVPLTAGVHDRAWVEVMRGCTRGCRFCQAGMWYRPVRERRPDTVMAMAGAQLDASGHQELALASLSTTDYSGLEPVLRGLVEERPEVRLSLPSLRVDSAAVRLAHLASPTGPSFTLAPEAGSQRMRDLINKNVTEDDIMAAAEEVFRGGCTTLKLYFVIGFPMETDEDVQAIADVCLRVRESGRKVLGPRASRLQLNLSVNNFVPKPLTPFQWAGMADRATLRARQEMLRSRLRKPGVRLTLHDVDKSFLEAALARGGEEYADIIEGAWRRGAFFDSWTERFRRDAWEAALAERGLDIEAEATKGLSRDSPLPWDVIENVADRDFLWTEWEKATRGETTPDCRWGVCADCGACGPGIGNDLAVKDEPAENSHAACAEQEQTDAAGLGSASSGASSSGGRLGPSGPGGAVAHTLTVPAAVVPAASFGYVLTFAVRDRARFVGHLDKTEIFRRAMRRAGATLALSAGMRPKALLTLGQPLAVGVGGERELCEFRLRAPAPDDLLARLADALPEGLEPISLERYDGRKSVAARVVAVHYGAEVALQGSADHEALQEACLRLQAATSVVVDEQRGDKNRTVDVRKYVGRVDVEVARGGRRLLLFRVAVTPSGSVRPERVVEALELLGAPKMVVRELVRTRIELS